jgi:N-acetylglucosaminyldiphosphoundecaprenol N-acetyl-beta-D-mannosaminyltransferase
VSAARYRLGRLRFASLAPAQLFQIVEPGLRHVVTVNAEIFVLAHEDPAYEALLGRTLNTVDGRPVQWLVALRNRGPAPRKLSGSDLLDPLAAFCAEHGHRLFLLGGTERVNALAVARLRAEHPGADVAGYAAPFTHDVTDAEWNAGVLAVLQRVRPTHLVVALGPPKADYWIAHARPRLEGLGIRFAAGFGGAMSFVAGLVPRAPRWVQWLGLEWLFRLAVEPARWRRTGRQFRLLYHAFARVPA